MVRIGLVRAALLGCALAGAPAQALADGFVVPFAGVNFGGDSGQTFGQATDKGSPLTWGVQVGGMKSGTIGAELDISYTRNFFGDFGSLGDNSVLSLVPAVIVGIPVGGQDGLGIRPYVTGGVGMIRRKINVVGFDVFNSNEAAYSLGGGVMGFLGTHFGIRGDYRYFGNFGDDEIPVIDVPLGKFNYSRLTAGAIFRF